MFFNQIIRKGRFIFFKNDFEKVNPPVYPFLKKFSCDFTEWYKNGEPKLNKYIDGQWTDYEDCWTPAETNTPQDKAAVQNIVLHPDYVRLVTTPVSFVGKPEIKYLIGMLTKRFPPLGIYRVLVKSDCLSNLCNAFWLFYGYNLPVGGVNEYDYEFLGQNPQMLHLAHHYGYHYSPNNVKHSKHNKWWGRCFNITDWNWLEFKITPYDISWIVNGMVVKKIKVHGCMGDIKVILGTGTGGISPGKVNDKYLPAGFYLKKFEYYRYDIDY